MAYSVGKKIFDIRLISGRFIQSTLARPQVSGTINALPRYSRILIRLTNEIRAAWPTGPSNIETFTDASYIDTLNGAPYIMGVSPYFYTNMPGFRKNWL